uniref:Uncharacterized protein n=1 Tax=Aegilops tauschii subsp. strangulata TaxID=200361 RepID=A0A453NN16_AEGTS
CALSANVDCLPVAMHYNTMMIGHISFVVQCDLIPAWATKGWLRTLLRDYPTLPFHASINKSFGKVNEKSWTLWRWVH